MSAELLPCPCCGNKYPWEYITFSCCVLRCECGLEVQGAAISPVYKMDKIPDALREFASPATALHIRLEGGVIQEFPEHGYYSVPVTESFKHFGFAAIWNRRAP